MPKEPDPKPAQRVDFNDPEVERRYEEAVKRAQKKVQPQVEAIRRSRRITAEDLAIVINCRADDPIPHPSRRSRKTR